MQKYVVITAAVLMQLALGGIYAWSTFVPALIRDYSFTSFQTQLIFGLTIASFTLTMTAASRVLQAWGPRTTSTIGGVLFGAGHLLAAVSGGSYFWILLGIAGLSGMGIGFGYMCPLSTSIAWFPERKGLITGIVVAGFGAGAVALSSAANAALTAGVEVLQLLGWVGSIAGGVILLAALFLRLPADLVPQQAADPKNATAGASVPTETSLPTQAFLRTRTFRFLSAAMFCGTFAGLLVIGNLGPMAIFRGGSPQTAAAAVAAFAVGNGLGRLSWGWLFDRYQQTILPISLWTLAVAVTILTLPALTPALFPVVSLAVGFGFGANFVLFAAAIAQKYGRSGLARYYPWVFLFYGLAGIMGPSIGGVLVDRSGTFHGAVWLAALVASAGALLVRPVNIRPASLSQHSSAWKRTPAADDGSHNG